ncbi:type I polyketide synthase [Nocardia asteroides]
MSTEQGLALFDVALRLGGAAPITARLDMTALRALATEGALPPILTGLAAGSTSPGTQRRSALRERLSEVDDARGHELVLDAVRATAAAVLGHASVDAVPADRAFEGLGFDSLTGVEFRNRLTEVTGVRLPSTIVFDHPTPGALAERLLAEIGGAVSVPAPRPVAAAVDADPIVIVGMGCRFPGDVRSPEDFWNLVADNRDAIGPLPTERGWNLEELFDPDPDAPGRTYVRAGGFLHDAADFDAAFFGISPREALAMDPQQRLLLEVTWEALEHAGIHPVSLRGSDTGVYTGVINENYGIGSGAMPAVQGFRLTGGSTSVASGRVAYVLGLEGPAVSMDTACSSSLVALHSAVGALRAGECAMALAGGATIMATPETLVDLGKQRVFAPDARSKAFSDTADGAGFSEGVGVLVLERLSDARRLGHEVLAVVAGSAVNQDGASNGLTAPNGPSQQRVIHAALASAGLSPADVDAVEAHGTGTELGDPIEAQALLATYGRSRTTEHPLWLGSVKSNIGHTQAAAGMAGVIKMVQAMRYETLPRTLHVDTPSSHVDWSAGTVRVLTEARPWQPPGNRPRRAAVSSFGISGTNAHVILEQAPEPAAEAPDPGESSPHVTTWLLSGRTREALLDQARRLRRFVDLGDGTHPAEVAAALAVRSVFEHRAAVVGTESAALSAGLTALVNGTPATGVAHGQAVPIGKTVFVFPGQGSQWIGMGRELLDTAPAFAEQLRECAAVIDPMVDWSLLDVVRGVTGAPALDRIEVVQPAIFAVMVSLARLWRSRGVVPEAVVGHSQGEIAAAYVAGVLSLEDAARVVVLRSRLFADAMVGKGAIASVGAPRDVVERELSDSDDLWISGVNSPSAVTVTGGLDSLTAFVTTMIDRGYRARVVPDTVASHSPYVEPLRAVLGESLRAITPRDGEIPVYSTVVGGPIAGSQMNADYWYRNCRSPVLFEPTVRALRADGFTVFVESSPHPVLVYAVEETVGADTASAIVVGSLRRDESAARCFAESVAEAFVRGVPVDRQATGARRRARIDLPTYAFQRQRYWLDAAWSGGRTDDLGVASAGHPLLGAVLDSATDGKLILSGRLTATAQPWLTDHALWGRVLFPGAGFVELTLRAGVETDTPVLRELVLHTPLLIAEDDAPRIQVVVEPADETGDRAVAVYSSNADDIGTDGPWTLHAQGFLGTDAAPSGRESLPFEPTRWPPPGAQSLDVVDAYDTLAVRGYDYGPAFQGLRALWRRGAEIFVEAELAARESEEADSFGLHPALLDAVLHGATIAEAGAGGGDAVALPFAWSGVVAHGGGAPVVRARIIRAGDEASIEVADATGRPLLTVGALSSRPVTPDQLGASRHDDALLAVTWDVVADIGAGGSTVEWAALDVDAVPDLVVLRCAPDGEPVADDLDTRTSRVLAAVRRWLSDERFGSSRLAVVTEGAVSVEGERVTDVVAASVRGLVRSAQSENPGRIIMIDTDGSWIRRRSPGPRATSSRSVTDGSCAHDCAPCPALTHPGERWIRMEPSW